MAGSVSAFVALRQAQGDKGAWRDGATSVGVKEGRSTFVALLQARPTGHGRAQGDRGSGCASIYVPSLWLFVLYYAPVLRTEVRSCWLGEAMPLALRMKRHRVRGSLNCRTGRHYRAISPPVPNGTFGRGLRVAPLLMASSLNKLKINVVLSLTKDIFV